MQEQEIWKSLNGLVENGENYEISNFGTLRSIERIDSRGCKRKSRIIKNFAERNGYRLVGLSSNNITKTYSVHRLVALAYMPNENIKLEVNHKDGNKSNNCVDNLEWSTRSENVQHAYNNKLINKKDVGENNHLSKLNNESVIEIRKLYKTKQYTQTKLGEMFGVSQDAISRIVNFQTWKHI